MICCWTSLLLTGIWLEVFNGRRLYLRFLLGLDGISSFGVAPSGVVAISTLNIFDAAHHILNVGCTIGIRLQGIGM